MGRLIKKPRRRGAKSLSKSTRYKTPGAKITSSISPSTRSGRRKGWRSFVKRNYKIIVAASFAVVVVALGLILLFGGKETATTSDLTAQAAETSTAALDVDEFNEEEEYSYTDVDESILEGLAGTDESLFADDEALAEALLAETGIRIGVTIGDLSTDNDELLLSMLEEAACSAEEAELVYKVYYYDAGGDYNQQLQDVRSLIKNEVDVIIIGSTDEESFEMVSNLAEAAGIPVVAYNASVATGYAINVVAAQKEWGNIYGRFMADNLETGNIVQILGNEESDIDQERQEGIDLGLATNGNIVELGTTYAMWNSETAYDAMTAYLDENDQIDGVITEEGMAERILDAYVEAGVLPKVMCGDATAGFIKKWYELLNGGIDITPEDEDSDDDEEQEPVMFEAQEGELVVCAQPAPTGISAVAFEIALKIAKGRTLKTEGLTLEYEVETLITQDNLSEYYELIKDEDDDYVVRNEISDETIEALFEEEAE